MKKSSKGKITNETDTYLRTNKYKLINDTFGKMQKNAKKRATNARRKKKKKKMPNAHCQTKLPNETSK